MKNLNELLENYQQGAGYIDTEEAIEIASYIEKEGQMFPFEGINNLYRGVCLGYSHEVGDVIEVSLNYFESWSEDIQVAEEFSKEKGPEISAIYVLYKGNVKGLALEDYSGEMEWLLQKNEYIVDEIEEHDDYTLYYLIIFKNLNRERNRME